MKRKGLLFAAIVASTVFCHAQFFLGGGISFSAVGGSTEFSSDKNKNAGNLNFYLYPQAGYSLTQKTDIGGYLTFRYSHYNDHADSATIAHTITMGVTPFFRYYVLSMGKFSMFAQANLPFTFSVVKSKTGVTSAADRKEINVGFFIFPGISYKLNRKIELMASLNFLNFGYAYNSTKIGDFTYNNSNLNLGINMDNVFTTGNIMVGAIIRL